MILCFSGWARCGSLTRAMRHMVWTALTAPTSCTSVRWADMLHPQKCYWCFTAVHFFQEFSLLQTVGPGIGHHSHKWIICPVIINYVNFHVGRVLNITIKISVYNCVRMDILDKCYRYNYKLALCRNCEVRGCYDEERCCFSIIRTSLIRPKK